MKTQVYTQAIERPASPIERAPLATRLDAPLLAIVFNLLGAEIVRRGLPILRLLANRSPSGQ
jgi:hypothetical protein